MALWTSVTPNSVAAAFGQDIASSPTTAAAPSATVDVINAGMTEGLAASVSRALTNRGYSAGKVSNATGTEPAGTGIAYGRGADGDAATLAKVLGIEAPVQADPSLADRQVRVTLGADFVPPATLNQPADGSIGTSSPTPGADRSADGSDVAPDAGRPIGGGAIPCVD